MQALGGITVILIVGTMLYGRSAAAVDAQVEGSPVASPAAVDCDDVRSALANVGKAFAEHQTAMAFFESLEDESGSILPLSPGDYQAIADDTIALAEDLEQIGRETAGIAGEWITASAVVFAQLADLFRALAEELNFAGRVRTAQAHLSGMAEESERANALEAEIEAACGFNFRIEPDGTLVEEPLAATPTP